MSAEVPHGFIDTIGLEPALWGGVISVGLFGALLVQAYIYAVNNRDGWLLRSLVVFVIAADFADIILSWMILRFVLLENHASPASLLNIPSYVYFHSLLFGLVVFGVQLFFASRVYLLNKKNVWGPAIIVLTGLGGLAVTILVTVDCARLGFIVAFNITPRVKVAGSCYKVLFSIGDILSAFFLTKYLWGFEGAKSTKAVAAKLIQAIVTRGILVTILQIISIVVYTKRTETLKWVALSWNIPKIYIMTMLAILNSREGLKASLSGTLQLTSLNFADPVRLNGTGNIAMDRSPDQKFQRSEGYGMHPRMQVQTETYQV